MTHEDTRGLGRIRAAHDHLVAAVERDRGDFHMIRRRRNIFSRSANCLSIYVLIASAEVVSANLRKWLPRRQRANRPR